MSPSLYAWMLSGHIIGILLWIGALFTVYWMLRLHTQTPKDVSDKLTLMERSMAIVMDLGATLAIGTGIAMAVSAGGPRGTHPVTNLFAAPGAGWFHIKLTLVVLCILSVHGFVRSRVAKFSRGETPSVPSWPWSLLLVGIVGIAIMVMRGPMIFAK